jgi:hypothetical protein
MDVIHLMLLCRKKMAGTFFQTSFPTPLPPATPPQMTLLEEVTNICFVFSAPGRRKHAMWLNK